MKIYIVNGAPGSGKTTFENIVKEEQLIKYHQTYILSTIDFVKKIAYDCGWDGTKTLRNRQFLSDLKDLLTEWGDVPNLKIKEELEKIKFKLNQYGLSDENCIIFIDCREPQEIKKLCDSLKAKSLLIKRESAELNETSNHADRNVLDYIYDIVILNNGTIEDLQKKAINFLIEEASH